MMQGAVWVFDVDGCLVDSLAGTSLRPGARDLLTHLRSSGRCCVLWSAGGAAYAEQRADEHDIGHLFSSFHGKVDRDRHGRYIPDFVSDMGDAVFVDDRPEDLPLGATIVGVSPYLAGSPHDTGLRQVCELAGFRWAGARGEADAHLSSSASEPS